MMPRAPLPSNVASNIPGQLLSMARHADILAFATTKPATVFANPIRRISHNRIHLAQRRQYLPAVAEVKDGISDMLNPQSGNPFLTASVVAYPVPPMRTHVCPSGRRSMMVNVPVSGLDVMNMTPPGTTPAPTMLSPY